MYLARAPEINKVLWEGRWPVDTDMYWSSEHAVKLHSPNYNLPANTNPYSVSSF